MGTKLFAHSELEKWIETSSVSARIARRVFFANSGRVLAATAAGGSVLGATSCGDMRSDSITGLKTRRPQFVTVPWDPGTTDFSTAIENAINAAGAGGTVQLESG